MERLGGDNTATCHDTDERQEILIVAGEAVEPWLIEAMIGLAEQDVVIGRTEDIADGPFERGQTCCIDELVIAPAGSDECFVEVNDDSRLVVDRELFCKLA